MLKLDSNVGVICLGVLSVVLAFSYAESPGITFWDNIYLTVLQLLGGVGLIIGVQTQNHLFFLPWLIFTCWFTLLLSFVFIIGLILGGPYMEYILIVMLFEGILWLALYSVGQAFNRIRKERAMSGLINNV